MMSSLSLGDDAIQPYTDMRKRSAHSYILYEVYREEIKIIALGEPDATFDDLKAKIKELGGTKKCLYCATSFKFHWREKMILISWMPPTVHLGSLMRHHSTLDAFKSSLEGLQFDIAIEKESELDADFITSALKEAFD